MRCYANYNKLIIIGWLPKKLPKIKNKDLTPYEI